MGAAGIEIPEWINPQTVERAHRRASLLQKADARSKAEGGFRAARARDPKMMLVLEQAANILAKIQEEQHGRTQRSASTPYSHRVDLTEFSMWREAYNTADRGEPERALIWYYAAAAELAGLV